MPEYGHLKKLYLTKGSTTTLKHGAMFVCSLPLRTYCSHPGYIV